MKKLLLVGKFNNVLESLNQYLMNHFDVQLCAQNMESVNGMVKIARPDILVICMADVEGINLEFFDEFQKRKSQIPAIVLGLKDDCEKFRDKYGNEHCVFIARPVTGEMLLEQCNEMLGLNKNETLNLEVSEAAKAQPEKKKVVLVVDDSGLMLRNVKSLIEYKYQVNVVTSGEKALVSMEKRRPDLILLDYDMPGWDGKQTFEKIRENPDYQDIPVVFLTGVAEKDRITSVLHLNPAGYILKPPDKDKLLSIIEENIG
ncbi:MAG: response regulator [Lachnospiraceae bacterium]|nr:response regulator [Lachnospiraceae bacterium]